MAAEEAFDLPAGDYKVRAQLGEAVAEVDVSVPGGETVDKVVIVATGKIIAHALFAEGGPTVTAGPRFDVLSPEPGPDGKRKTIATGYDDGADVRSAAGEIPSQGHIRCSGRRSRHRASRREPRRRSRSCSMPACSPFRLRAAIAWMCSAPRRTSMASRRRIATTYSEEWQIALPVGDYLIKVRKKDGSELTANASIKPGERTELTVQ